MALNIGELVLQISADTKGIATLPAAIQQLTVAIEKLTASIDNMSNKATKGFVMMGTAAEKSAKKAAQSKGYVEFFGEARKSAQDSATAMTRAFEIQNLKIKQAVEVNKSYTKEQNKVNKSAKESAKVFKEAEDPEKKFGFHLTEISKTATVALGPLNGVASRITAIGSIASSSAIPLAILLGGFAAFAVLAAKSTIAASHAESSFFQMDASLKALGNTSGLTTKQVNDMAVSLAEATLTSTAMARQAAVAALSFNGVGKSVSRVLSLAEDMTQVFGGNLLENTKILGRALEDPISGLDRLRRVGVRFTEGQKELIKSFILTGDRAKATQMILDEVSNRVGGKAVAAAKGLAGTWDTLGERITRFLETVGGMESKSGALNTAIAEVSKTLKQWSTNGELAQKIGESIANGFKVIASTAMFVVKHIELLTTAMIGMAVGGIAQRVVPAIVLYIKSLYEEVIATNAASVATGRLSAVFKIFSTVVKTSPIGLIAGVIAILITKFTLFSKSAEDATKTQKGLNDSINDGADAVNNLTKALTPSEEKFKAINDQIKVQKTHLEDLKKKYAEYEGTALGGAIAIQIHKTEDAIKSLEKELPKLTAAIPGEQESAWIKDINSQFLKMAPSIIQGYSAAKKFKDALDLTQGLEKLSKYQSLTKDQIRFIEIVKAEQKKGGANEALFGNIDDLEKKLTRAKEAVKAFGIGGKAGEEAIKKLNQQFYTADAIDKWKDKIKNLSSEALQDLARKVGITNGALLTNQQIIDRVSTKLGAAAGKAKELQDSVKSESFIEKFNKISSGITPIINALSSLVSAQLSAYQELASYHKQMAEQALSYGKEQSNMWMKLADTVYYSNNKQAQSFQDRAVAAAEAAAQQYQAEKQAQARANELAKKAFENQKSLQIVQAIISTATAVMQTYTNSGLGIFAAPLAAGMAAIGAAQIALIERQQYTPRQNGGPISAGKGYLVGESGPEYIIPSTSGHVVNNKDLMNSVGGTNVNFTIQALDTSDGTKIIYENRGMIINIIKEAQNNNMGRGM